MNKLKIVRHVYMTWMWSPRLCSLDTFISDSFPSLSKCHSPSKVTNGHHCLYSMLSRTVKMSIKPGTLFEPWSFQTYDFHLIMRVQQLQPKKHPLPWPTSNCICACSSIMCLARHIYIHVSISNASICGAAHAHVKQFQLSSFLCVPTSFRGQGQLKCTQQIRLAFSVKKSSFCDIRHLKDLYLPLISLHYFIITLKGSYWIFCLQ